MLLVYSEVTRLEQLCGAKTTYELDQRMRAMHAAWADWVGWGVYRAFKN